MKNAVLVLSCFALLPLATLAMPEEIVTNPEVDAQCELVESSQRQIQLEDGLYDVICTRDEFLKLFAYPDNIDGNYVLGADMDMSEGAEAWSLINYDRTIGSGSFAHTPEMSFRGKFDGNGHTISNFYYDNEDAYYVGIFGMTRGAEIRNLKLDRIYLNGSAYTGALVGKAVDTKIENIFATNVWVRGHRVQGGLVGAHIFDVKLKEGIIRERQAQGTDDYIKNVFVAGTIEGRSGHSGGVIGYNHYPVSNATALVKFTEESRVSYAKAYIVGYNFNVSVTDSTFYPYNLEYLFTGKKLKRKFTYFEDRTRGQDRYEACSANSYMIKEGCKNDSNILGEAASARVLLETYPLDFKTAPEFLGGDISVLEAELTLPPKPEPAAQEEVETSEEEESSWWKLW